MRIYADRLKQHLSSGALNQRYVITGTDPLLLKESLDSLCQHAQQQDFLEKYQYEVNSQTPWNDIYDHCQALSLFSNRIILILDASKTSMNKAMTDRLKELAGFLHNDILLIFLAGTFNKRSENSAWFKAIGQQAILVQCITPDSQHLPQFIRRRCNDIGLNIEPEAIQLLAKWHEGNLLALNQSIEKLALLYSDNDITLPRVEKALEDHSSFTVYAWTDALLSGQAARSLHILKQLEHEGTESIILLRTLQKELFILLQLLPAKENNTLFQQYDQMKIWAKKREIYNQALAKLDKVKLKEAIQLLTQAEINVKTEYNQQEWQMLASLSLYF